MHIRMVTGCEGLEGHSGNLVEVGRQEEEKTENAASVAAIAACLEWTVEEDDEDCSFLMMSQGHKCHFTCLW